MLFEKRFDLQNESVTYLFLTGSRETENQTLMSDSKTQFQGALLVSTAYVCISFQTIT